MKLGIQPGDVVLDVGCGVGGPAREIATFSGCNVVCLNNNDYQYVASREAKILILEFIVRATILPNVIYPRALYSSKEIL